jgi:carboxyl-terminal processing protease
MQIFKNKYLYTSLFLATGLVLGYFSNNIISYAGEVFNFKKADAEYVTSDIKTKQKMSAVDFNNLTILKEVQNEIDNKYRSWRATFTPPTAKEVEYGIVSGYVNSLNDPYTQYFPPVDAKTFEENVKGSFGGVGMEVGEREGYINVIAPLKGSPSEKAGIKAGDIVLSIDGKDVMGMSTEQAVGLIRGEVGTEVAIKIFRKDTKENKEIKIKRDVIKIPTIDTEKIDGVFVISLYSFSAESPELFRQALLKFAESGTNKLVVDLRGNPGGYLEAAVNIASFFLSEGDVVVSEKGNKGYGNIDHKAKAFKAFTGKLNLSLVVDGGSASASEILAGALQDHKVAKIYGQKSYGKGSVQEFVNLKTEGALKLTVATWYTPNGRSITEEKVVPDVEVKRTSTTTAESEMKGILKLINANK